MVPNPRVAQFARVESIGWTLPIDDTTFRIYVAGRVKQSGDIGRIRRATGGEWVRRACGAKLQGSEGTMEGGLAEWGGG